MKIGNNPGSAVFDFDSTMVYQESMAMFLLAVAGRRTYVSACCAAGAKAAIAPPGSRMTVFRAEILRRTLAGKTLGQARAAAENVFFRLEWISQIMEEFARHQDAGRRILVATGSLSVYMPALFDLKSITIDGLLSTEIVVDGDVLTGEMATASCTWHEKARRVTEWLSEGEGETWGYGNMPHDGAMLALTNYPTEIIKKFGRRPVRHKRSIFNYVQQNS